MKVMCIYRPPRGDSKKCIDKLTEILSRRENYKREIWFLGDFNIDYLKRAEVAYKRFQTFFKTFGLTQLIEGVTRPGLNSGTCIDWIVTNCRFVRESYVSNIFLSDHFAIECIRKKNRENNKNVSKTLRDYKNYNRGILIDLLKQSLVYENFRTSTDPNAMWELVYNNVIDILSVMCPYKKYVQRENPTPWMNADIYRTMRYRDRLVALYKVTKKDHYLSLAKQQRNIVNHMVETAKKMYITTLLAKNDSCPKKFWRRIKHLLHGDKITDQNVQFVDKNTSTAIPRGEEANYLNDYYCNISTRLGFNHDDIIHYNDEYLHVYQNIDDVFSLSNDPPTLAELESISDDIDLSKGSCVDGLSTQICKDLLKLAPTYFLEIFLVSIQESVFPTAWSTGTITVIPKTGDLSDPSNWRPITQTPIFAKIFEKIIHNRLTTFLTNNNILSKYQYGFRKGKSTQQAIFDLVKYIYSGLNHKKVVSTICLDVSKAFDCINHDILLYKLAKIGFDQNSLDWFKSYLTRTQLVKFDNVVSNKLSVKTGIGQGTILGPLLFIFYINDITTVLDHLKVNMYADDCILYSSGNEWNRMMLKIQPELDNVSNWCDHNRLKLNIQKSNSLMFGSRSKLGKIDYDNHVQISGIPLKNVSKNKYLGVTLDKEMTLSCLLSDVKKSVLNKLFNLRKLRYYINEKSSLAIYKQTILPIFDYAGFMLISCNKSDRHDLQVIQNDALRTCYNVKRRDKLSIASMHKRANLVGLEQRRSLQLLSLMYLHKDDAQNLMIANRQTRAAARAQFYTERYNTCKYKNSPFYKGSEEWKLLPIDIATSDSIFQFKQLFKNRYNTYVDI